MMSAMASATAVRILSRLDIIYYILYNILLDLLDLLDFNVSNK